MKVRLSMIEFNQVSYSYQAPRNRKQKKPSRLSTHTARQESPKATKHGENIFLSRSQKPAWGNDPAAIWALEDISFSVHDGEFFGIAGHTGSGKSTLIQHMNGLLSPTEGRVLIDGREPYGKNAPDDICGQIGIVFQYPERQLFAQTVFEDVAFGPRNLKLDAAEIEQRYLRAMEVVGLDANALREISPFELSGGQQRRVAFAGVLAMGPRVLVLDEPTAGLDPQSRASFLALIERLHTSERLTVVMVSHNMDDLARLCDRVLILEKGRLFALGTPAEVFADEGRLNQVGLALPSTARIARKLQAAGMPVTLPTGDFSIETLADCIAETLRKDPVEATENTAFTQGDQGKGTWQ